MKRRTATCRSRRPLADTSRTIGGTGGTTPARARRNAGGRRSIEYHRMRFRRPGRHNGGGDEKASSVPNYGARQRSRFQLPYVWDRQRWWTRSRPRLETEYRKGPRWSGKRWNRPVGGRRRRQENGV